MGATSDPRRRKLFLAASLTVNLGTLFIFKYFNFFNQSFATLAAALSLSYPDQRAERAAAGRHFVLHLPVDGVHD